MPDSTYTASSTDDVDDEVDDQSDHESEIPQFNLLPPPLEVATARLAAARLADSPIGQPNNAVAAVAGTSATHRLGEEALEPRRSERLSGKAVNAVAATTREETEHVLQEFLQDPNIVGLAVHSRAAPATLNKNKSQLNTSYSMLEAVLDSGKFPGGDVAQPQALRALKLFFVTRPTTYEERCSHLYKCYMTDYKLLCMVLCTLATGYRKANDGGKCSAESLRQRMSSLARILRGEHHVVQTAKNDMAPILVPDDLMDFNGRFALMWKVIDGHDKIAFKAGEITHTRKRAGIVTEEDLVKAAPHMEPYTPAGLLNRVIYALTTGAFLRGDELVGLELHHLVRVSPGTECDVDAYKIKDIACKNWKGGLADLGREPPQKFIRGNPSLPSSLDEFEKAKLCNVSALDLLLSKHPKSDPKHQRLLLKPLPSAVKDSPVWYGNQAVGIGSVRLNWKAMFPHSTLHGGKRSAATAALSSGAPLPLVQREGGWKCPDSVAVYLHADKEARQKLSDAINAPMVAAALRTTPSLSSSLPEPQSSLGAPTAETSVPVAPPVATIPPATPASTLGWQAMAAANGWVAPSPSPPPASFPSSMPGNYQPAGHPSGPSSYPAATYPHASFPYASYPHASYPPGSYPPGSYQPPSYPAGSYLPAPASHASSYMPAPPPSPHPHGWVAPWHHSFAGPPNSLQPQPAPWPCIPAAPWIDPQAAQRLHEFHAHEAAGKALKMKLLAVAAAI